MRRPLRIITQDHCAFYNDCNLYQDFPGISNDASEGQNIARALGNKKAAILSNHGMLTGSNSVEATVFWYLSLEKCCRTQLLAEAACAGVPGSKIHEIDDAAAAEYAASYQRSPFSTNKFLDLIGRLASR